MVVMVLHSKRRNELTVQYCWKQNALLTFLTVILALFRRIDLIFCVAFQQEATEKFETKTWQQRSLFQRAKLVSFYLLFPFIIIIDRADVKR